MNIILFNKVWNNIYLKNHIFQFVDLYNNNSIVTINSKEELLELPDKNFISTLNFGEGERVYIQQDYDYDNFGGRDDKIEDYESDLDISGIPSSVTCLNIGYQCTPKLVVGSIPLSVTSLSFNSNNFNRKLKKGHIPPSVTSLSFKSYNVPFSSTSIPSSVTNLVLSKDFTQLLIKNSIPPSVKKLEINSLVKLCNDSIPSSVTNLKLIGYFNCSLTAGQIPSSVKKLTIGDYFNQELKRNDIPNGVEIIKLGYLYNHQLSPYVIPSSVKVLLFSNVFNHPIYEGDIPRGVRVLRMSSKFNQKLVENDLPVTLIYLDLGSKYNKGIGNGVLPSGLKELVISKEFSKSKCCIPSSVVKLTVPDRINSEIIPTSVQSLHFIDGYIDYRMSYSLDTVERRPIIKIPNTIQKISINIFQLCRSSIPPSVTCLKLRLYSDQPDFTQFLTNSITSLSIYSIEWPMIPLPNLPSTIKSLKLIGFNNKISPTTIPSSVTNLLIHTSNQIPPNTLPSSIVKLTLSLNSNDIITIEPNTIPSSVKELNIYENLTQQLSSEWIPPSVTSISIPHDYNFTNSIDSIPSTIKIINRNKPIKLNKSLNYKKILNKYNK